MDKKKICKCKYCERETFNKNDDYCIFHSKDIEGKKNQFNDAFDKEFKLQDQDGDDFHFIEFIFPNDFDYFARNTIKKDMYFYYTIFKGEAYFWRTIFKREAHFVGSIFEGRADFREATFEGKADFGEAKFEEKAYFMQAKFEEKVGFSKAIFKRETDFLAVKFQKKADFNSTAFEGEVSFLRVIFKKEADFGKAKFKEEAYFELKSFKLEIIDYNKLNLEDTFFYDLHGLLDQVGEEIKNNKLDNIYYINKFKKTSKNKILSKLKNWFINRFRITKFVNNQINPTLGERTYKRYPIIARTISDDNYLIRFKIKHPKLFLVWWFFSDCGRSIFRWAIWSIIFALTFATKFYGVYCLHPEFFYFNTHIKSQSFLSFIYYSVVTFTTLGFGDIIPTIDKMQIWVMAEVVLGYIMLGGLISIFANKIARRS